MPLGGRRVLRSCSVSRHGMGGWRTSGFGSTRQSHLGRPGQFLGLVDLASDPRRRSAGACDGSHDRARARSEREHLVAPWDGGVAGCPERRTVNAQQGVKTTTGLVFVIGPAPVSTVMRDRYCSGGGGGEPGGSGGPQAVAGVVKL